MSEVALFRTDAGPDIGTGHLMRCLALAQAWVDAGGRAVFAASEMAAPLGERLAREGFGLVAVSAERGSDGDGGQTAVLARAQGASTWCVLDGPGFDLAYQRRLRSSGARLLVIDDSATETATLADLVLNQNLHASQAAYRGVDAPPRLLLGPRYVVLRREFRPWRAWSRAFPAVGAKLLVTLGGADPHNQTGALVAALGPLASAGVEVLVLVGGANPRRAEIARQAIAGGLRVEHDVADMAARIAWADVAITSGGTTVWEMACLGLPAVVGAVAPVERLLLEGLAREDLFLCVGWLADQDPVAVVGAAAALLGDAPRRSAMSAQARALVDGDGALRVVAAMQQVGQHVGTGG